MENKNKVLLTVLSVATLLVALVGATFAYFSATDSSEQVEISTGAATISLEATNNSVSNIRPTTFDKAKADSGDDKNIVKMTLNVTGTSNVAGSYAIKMNEPVITVGSDAEQGTVSDIKYSVYSSASSTPIIENASFTGTEKVTPIAQNTFESGDVTGTYYVYVWVDNNDKEQNNLQDVSFKLTFTADVSTQTAAN